MQHWYAWVLIENYNLCCIAHQGWLALETCQPKPIPWEQKANSYDIKEICGYDNHVSLLCCLVFLKWLISSTPDHWVTNKNVFPGWLDCCFQGNNSFSYWLHSPISSNLVSTCVIFRETLEVTKNYCKFKHDLLNTWAILHNDNFRHFWNVFTILRTGYKLRTLAV